MKIDKKSAAVGAAVATAALAIALPRIADAAGASPSPSPSTSQRMPGDMGRHCGAEKELTGSTAAKVKAAVLAKLPDSTIERMSAEDSRESAAAYEARVTKTDGTRVEVLLDKNFAVTAINADHHGGGHGFGRFGGEQELTGSTADKVKAAVLAKLPGATVERMSSEDSREGTGAAYEAHVTKADGSRVEVLLDKSFAVTAVNADRRGGFRDHGGAPGDGGGAPGTTNNGTSGGGDLGATDAVLYTA